MPSIRGIRFLTPVLMLFPVTAAFAVDFVNGAFESALGPEWTTSGSQFELITFGDADADVELRLYWSYSYVLFPSGDSVDTSISQTVTLDSTDYTLGFKTICDYSDPDGMAGHGDAYAVVRVELLDAGDAVLAQTQWTNIADWQQVNLHLHTFALSQSANPASVAKVKLTALVEGTPPVIQGWSVDASVRLDDVTLQATPAGVEDWFVFE